MGWQKLPQMRKNNRTSPVTPDFCTGASLIRDLHFQKAVTINNDIKLSHPHLGPAWICHSLPCLHLLLSLAISPPVQPFRGDTGGLECKRHSCPPATGEETKTQIHPSPSQRAQGWRDSLPCLPDTHPTGPLLELNDGRSYSSSATHSSLRKQLPWQNRINKVAHLKKIFTNWMENVSHFSR